MRFCGIKRTEIGGCNAPKSENVPGFLNFQKVFKIFLGSTSDLRHFLHKINHNISEEYL